ncbi:hypothetical protein CK203_087746 [Vitis vinifera]|uniref:Uncharacterized protein n=1 Tax=Vitis vinifera TaxID=29760 RepID=A0A438CV89_VITVI|nr:hypothetical protein CK203_087746 [Vitis vinifera]
MAPKKTVSSVRGPVVNEEAAMPTEKGGKNAILFTKEQFNAGLRFPLPALFKEFLHFSQIPPSSFTQPCPGADGMQHHQHACVRSPALPSNGDRTARFDKGRGEGAGGSLGWMGGAIAASVEAFFSELYLKNSGFGIEGPPCGLGGKGVLCLEELPLYQEAKEADAERRRKLLEDRDQKKLKALSGRLPDRSGVRTPSKENFRKKGKLVKKHGKDEGTHSSQGVSSSTNYL